MNVTRPNLLTVRAFSLALIAGLFVCCRTSSAQNREQAQAIWREKVQKSKQLFDWFKSHITCSITKDKSTLLWNGKRQTVETQIVMKRKDSFYILTSEALNASPMAGSFCYGINSKYAFKLKKAKNGKDWVIERIVEVTPDFDEKSLGTYMSGIDATTSEKIEGFRDTVNRRFDQNLLAVSLIAGNSVGIPSIIDPWNVEKLPGFRLHSISTDGQGQERLHLNFEYKVKDSETEKIGVSNCHVDFNLEPHCYPVKSHQVMKNGDEETTLDWSKVFKKNSEKEYELKYFSCLKRTKNDVTTQFVESQEEAIVSLDDRPESDFTLSAFGLPEPPDIEWKRPFPWYLVFACIGAACLGAFFLRARGRRLRGG